MNLSKAPLEILDISNLILERPKDLEIDVSYRNKIFALYKDYLDLLDIESMSILPSYLKNIKGFGLHSKWLYTLDRENNVFKQAYESSKKELVEPGAQIGSVFLESKFYKIKVLQDGLLLFLGQKGELLTNLWPFSITKQGVLGLDVYKRNLQLLYWTKQSIGFVDFSREFWQHTYLYTGRNITDCLLINEGSAALFIDNNKLYLAQIQPQGEPHIEFVTDIKNDTSFFYSETSGSVYYLEPERGLLNSIKIIPK